jgi:hypothetical protein
MNQLFALTTLALLSLGLPTLYSKDVSFTFRNSSEHVLDWVELEDARINPIGGAMNRGKFKTTNGLIWKNDLKAKLTLVDNKTGHRYTIPLSFEDVTKAIKAGTCDHVIVTITDYDKALVTCERRPK